MPKYSDIVSFSMVENNFKDASDENDCGFSYYETIGYREEQEDSLTWLGHLDKLPLSPLQIGKRIWAVLKQLDMEVKNIGSETSGTTATVNYYDGRGNVITATLADSHSFIVVFGKNRNPIKVKRLNSIAHKPGLKTEKARLLALNGHIVMDDRKTLRVNGSLAVSRAIGDYDRRLKGEEGDWLISADSTIDMTNLANLTRDIKPSDIESIEIISTCDGFTDGAAKEKKSVQESYLYRSLKSQIRYQTRGLSQCQALADQAIEDGSTDNISVCCQEIYHHDQWVSQPFFFGVFDGHGGKGASTYVANHIGERFRTICRLPQETFAKCPHSPEQNRMAYQSDNNIARIALQYFEFDRQLASFYRLKKNIAYLAEGWETLDDLLDGIERAKQDWLANPDNHAEFFTTCRALIREAQTAELNRYQAGQDLLQWISRLICLILEFVTRTPVVKPSLLSRLSVFSKRIDQFEGQLSEDLLASSDDASDYSVN